MDQLDLIWELELHNENLEKHNKELMIIKQKVRISSIKDRISKLRSRADEMEKNLDEKRNIIKKREKILKEYLYRSKEIDLELYRGHISNIKQLEHLSQERDNIVGIIDEIELEILEIMEEIEDLENHYRGDSHKLDIYMCELEDNEVEYEREIVEIEDMISHEKGIIDKIKVNIDKDILQLYENIKEKKGKGIVSVDNGICSGCNMMLPRYILNILSENTQIVQCENCGRLLYMIKNV